MSEPIYASLIHHLDQAGLELRSDADEVRDWITRHITPRHYAETQDQVLVPATKGTTAVSLADTLTSDLTEGLAYVKGWVGRLDDAAQAGVTDVVNLGAKYPKIVEALQLAGDAIDPSGEAIVAGWIKDLAGFAQSHGVITTPTAAPAEHEAAGEAPAAPAPAAA